MLEEYAKKRNFKNTPEPEGQAAASGGDLKFVIQKHSARRLHYDFRLEVGGVLVSWAVPKGPSLDPAVKHLAVQTEDHPFDYRNFEGVIPAGQYGGGPVIIWDEGTYCPEHAGSTAWGDRKRAEQEMVEGLKKGKITIFLRGKKLHGSWTLFRLGKTKKDWILMKHKDEFADRDKDITADDRSVVSGATIEEMRAGKPPAKPAIDLTTISGARLAPFPREFSPMLASLAQEAFDEPGWLYEPKMDGIRAVAMCQGSDVRLFSRRALELSASYPELVEQLSNYGTKVIFDGEIVALDEKGVPSFQVLQQRSGLTQPYDVERARKSVPAYYYVFDILYLDGRLLIDVPLHKRKELLRQTLVPSDLVRRIDRLDTDGRTAFEAAVQAGLEGIVAKRLDSRYEPGKRSKSWLKVKRTMTADLVICGYTPGEGARASTFGSLVLGYYRDGQLVYAGGCGTGFNDKMLAALWQKFKRLQAAHSPFKQKVPGKKIVWLKPQLVAEVKFAQWTNDGMLRAPVFMHLREDKKPSECTREEVVQEIDSEQKEIARKQAADTQGLLADVVDLSEKRKHRQARTAQPRTSAPRLQPPAKALVEAVENSASKASLDVEGHRLSFTNLDKVFWPGTATHAPLKKRDYLLYLLKVSPWLLPHTSNRPLTFVRFPNGIKGGKFYQKHWEKGLPEFVETVWLYAEQAGQDQEYVVCNNLPTLLWLAQIADLEVHTWQSRIVPGPDAFDLPFTFGGSVDRLESSLLNYPDYLLFDLDPYLYSGHEGKGEEPQLHKEGFKKTVELAFWIKEMLDAIGVRAYVKTTGKTGLHMYVPIVREFTFDDIRALSETLGRAVLKQHPNEVTMEWAIVRRTGKVFLDYNMNSRGKTLASIYSPRVSPEAAVSMPLSWEELDSVYPTDFTMHNVPAILERQGDLWADILEHKNDLNKILEIGKLQMPPPKRKRRR